MNDKSDLSLKCATASRPGSHRLLVCALALILTSFAQSAPAAEDQPYASLRIVSPRPDATLRANRGAVRVVVDLSPALRADQGDRLTLWLDGRATAQMDGMEHLLKNVDRGTHTVQAQVDARSGAMLIRSEPVVFHLHHASRLVPQRRR